MAKRRIPTKPNKVRDQLMQATAGIDGEPNWPTTSPTHAEVSAVTSELAAEITTVNKLKAQFSAARARLRDKRDAGVAIIKRIDEVTDGLYGPDSPTKENFGLLPKKSTHGEHAPLTQVLITKIKDGVAPASIFVDWDTNAGARVYEMELYTDAALTERVGNVSTTVSEYEIHGLVSGQQYWIRVRAIRGNEFGSWSDPATRIANL